MPSKAYIQFLRNIETVSRLQETYEDAKKTRNKKGRGAFDHITRSAILFLVSSFEVYCEDVIRACSELLIKNAKIADNLPNAVKNTINDYALNISNCPPIKLCDDGWKTTYNRIVKEKTDALNTPNKANLEKLFKSLIGFTTTDINNISDIGKIDEIIIFRGEITHRVRAKKYVHIEKVVEYRTIIEKVVVAIDKKLYNYIKNKYHKAPWKNTYKKVNID